MALNSLAKTPADGFKSLTGFLNLSQHGAPFHVQQSKHLIHKAVVGNKPAYIIPKPAGAKGDVPVRVSYMQTNNGLNLELVYSYQVQLQSNWYHAHVSTRSGKVMALVDWVSDAIYRVLDVNKTNPIEDHRQDINVSVNIKASPFGWHSNKLTSYQDTRGNNVWAQENKKGDYDFKPLYRPSGGSTLSFLFAFHATQSPIQSKDAAITQLFYTINAIHDILYLYGFNEISGNFQDNNADKGGKGGDFIVANAQDETTFNNAYFSTPPDGYNGKMGMHLWDWTTPDRDSIFDIGIVIHEYGHGLSNRLTGGPANSDCLPDGESGGMGEGWADVLATVFRQKPSDKRTDSFLIGAYVYNGKGIRNYPYSTDLNINPSLFSFIDRRDYSGVHSIGEVWAVILLEVYWDLVDALGFTPDLYSASTSKGNTLFLHLMLNGMKLQPCYPTFIQARDAFIQAEAMLTQGKYACQLWRAFAKRGLGADAQRVSKTVRNGFQLPLKCQKTK